MPELLTALFFRQLPGGVSAIEDQSLATGKRFFVHSGTGTNAAGKGRSPSTPVATIGYAVGLCTANKGDRIYVMEGHNEGLGDAQMVVNVAGIHIIGLGWRANAPRIDFDHANASIDVTAAGCTIENLRLLPSVTIVTIGIDVNAGVTDTTLEDIEILPGEDGAGVDEFTIGIDVKAGCTRTKIVRPKIRQHASAASCIAGVKLTGASDDVVIEDPNIVLLGAAAVAPINGDTTLSTNLRILRGILVSDDEPGIELLTGTAGVIDGTKIFSNLATIAAATVADGMAHFGVKYVELGNESDAVVKTASIDD